jgi:hypothetical protein
MIVATIALTMAVPVVAGPADYAIKGANRSAPNPAQGFRTYFTESGIRVVPLSDTDPGWEFGLSVVGHGAASPRFDGHRVEYDRGSIVEWYVNDQRGLEQGFTLRHPPEDEGGTGVVIEMEVSGDLIPRLTDARQTLELIAPGSRLATLVYTDLKVWDATGNALPAHLELERRAEGAPARLRISIDTNGATFPIDVDPLIQGAAWSSAETDETWSVAWADWDNDGDLDLAVGNRQNQPNRVYENQDGSFVVAWTSAETDDTLSVAWGDRDNDGDLDLAVGNSNAPNRVYDNASGALTLVWSSTETDDTWSVAWGDWNRDGDLDLAVGNRNGSNRVYDNTGGALSLAWSSTETDDTWSVAWGDHDGDGDLDLAVGNLAEPNRVYDSTGTALNLLWSSTETDYTRSVAWGDLDGDGDLDLAAGNAAEPSRVYDNTGGTLSLVWSAGETDSTHSVAWGDWDDDGDLDLAAGNVSMPNRVWENDAGTLTLAWSSTEPDETRCIAWGDRDNDGDLDLAAGNNVGQPNRVHDNTGGLGLAWSSADSSTNSALAWGDWDGDGDLDLAITESVYVSVYENAAGSFTPVWSTPDMENRHDVAWGDWDGDGDLDLAVANTGGVFTARNQVYENTGGAMVLAWTSEEADDSRSVVWGDWDGDGDLDLAVGGYVSPNRVYENDGESLVLAWSSQEADRTTAVAWGDWDGDGDLDLAVGNMFGQAARVYENVGASMVLAWSSAEAHSASSVDWVDWEGDGDLDLSVGGSGAIYENDAGSLTLAWSGPVGVAEWGDWDGDGDLDVALGTTGTSVQANTGGALEEGWSSAEQDVVNDVAWGDWDGDGDLDLAVATNGPNRIYENGRFVSAAGLPETPAFPRAPDRPGTTANAYAYSTPERLASPITIDYSLVDAQSDRAWVVVPEYSLQGGGQWLPATQAGGDPTTDLATSPAGIDYTFVWDAEADDACSDNARLRFRVEWQAPDHAGHPVQRGATGTITPPFRLDCPMWYLDTDGDGFGDPAETQQARSQPGGYIATSGDCDDTNLDTHPGAPEVNDGLDNQCPGDQGHGVVDETSGDSGFHSPTDKTEYSWTAQVGATSYEVARSTTPDFSGGCTVNTTSDTFWLDAEDPLSGQVFHYMNRPVAPNAGSWGQDSTGAERTNVCP